MSVTGQDGPPGRTWRRFAREFKADSVAMVFDGDQSVAPVALVGIGEKKLGNWDRQARIDLGDMPGPTAAERAEIFLLRREPVPRCWTIGRYKNQRTVKTPRNSTGWRKPAGIRPAPEPTDSENSSELTGCQPCRRLFTHPNTGLGSQEPVSGPSQRTTSPLSGVPGLKTRARGARPVRPVRGTAAKGPRQSPLQVGCRLVVGRVGLPQANQFPDGKRSANLDSRAGRPLRPSPATRTRPTPVQKPKNRRLRPECRSGPRCDGD